MAAARQPKATAARTGRNQGSKIDKSFKLARDPISKKEALFPSRGRSRWLSLRNLGFAGLNWEFAVTLAAICGVFAWLLDTNARIIDFSLPEILKDAGTFWGALVAYFKLLIVSPWPALLVCAAAAGYYYAADFKPWYKRLFAGVIHTAAQCVPVVVLTIVLAFYAHWAEWSAVLILYVAVAGGITAATVMGIYLLICLNVFGRHWNEAFSSLRIQGHKCFLRFRIDPDGTLTIFPIGLRKVPRDRSQPPKNPELKPHLIETPIRFDGSSKSTSASTATQGLGGS